MEQMSLFSDQKKPLELFSYQQKAIDFIYEHDHTILSLPMGAGKTAIGGVVLEELLKDGHLQRVLIVAPKRVAELVWPTELPKFTDLQFQVCAGTPPQRHKIIQGDAPVVIINYELLLWLCDNYKTLPFDAVFYDEITRLKSTRSATWRAMRKHKFKITVGATGTFTSNSLLDIYGQVYMIDHGEHLGKSFSQFRARYFFPTDSKGWTWRAYDWALDQILDAIKPITFQLTDVYQLPDLMINNVIVRLPSQARAIYDKLKRELVINDEVIENVITKLQQVADGFAYQSDGSYIPIHEAKLEAFDEIMESQQGAPTLVIYKYRAELELMKACHPGPHLDSRVEAKPIIDAWNAGKLPVLYVHPASAGHGLNLQDGGNTIVWYGQTWSMEEHEQTIARLRRRGQKKTVWCHYILAADTIDMKLREAVKRKLNVFELAKEMMYS